LLKDEPLDFLMLCSSVNAICGFAGSVDYTAANCFLDALATSRFHGGRATVVSINWDAWRDVGMAFRRLPGNVAPSWNHREYGESAITPADGVEAFRRVMASGLPQVAVINRDLRRLLEESENPVEFTAADSLPERSSGGELHARPNLAPAYAAPETDTQRVMAGIWTESLGIGGIGLDDNFFELGGHSLLATAVLSRVRNSFGATITLRAVFDAPTIRLLSDHLDTLLWATSRQAAPVDGSEEREEIEL
jgi:hypothetical protein